MQESTQKNNLQRERQTTTSLSLKEDYKVTMFLLQGSN